MALVGEYTTTEVGVSQGKVITDVGRRPDLPVLEGLLSEAYDFGQRTPSRSEDEARIRDQLVEHAVAVISEALDQDPDALDPEITMLKRECDVALTEWEREKLTLDQREGDEEVAHDEYLKAVNAQKAVPSRVGLWLVGLGLAAVMGLIVTPTIEAMAFVDPLTGLPVPGALVSSFAVATAVCGVVVFGTLFSAHYPEKGFAGTHMWTAAGACLAVGVGVMRASQLGWNPTVIGLTIIELAFILGLEAVASILRARYATHRTAAELEARWSRAKVQLENARRQLGLTEQRYEERKSAYIGQRKWQAKLVELRDPQKQKDWKDRAHTGVLLAFERGQMDADRAALDNAR